MHSTPVVTPNNREHTMTQGNLVPGVGATAPDPIDLAHAMDDLNDALHRLGIVQRALTAERHRLQGDATADRATVLHAWRVNADLLAATWTVLRTDGKARALATWAWENLPTEPATFPLLATLSDEKMIPELGEATAGCWSNHIGYCCIACS